MEATYKSDDEKARLVAWGNEMERRRERQAAGWHDGATTNKVQPTHSNHLDYIKAWVRGRESRNKEVHGTNGHDPMPEDCLERDD